MESIPFLAPLGTLLDEAFPYNITVPQPVSGGGFVYKPGSGYYEFLLTAYMQFHTSAVVVNRNVGMLVKDQDGNTLQNIPAFAVQTAGLDFEYTWIYGMSNAYSTSANAQVMPLSPVLLWPTFTLQFYASNSAAGDQFKAIQLFVIRVPTTPEPTPAQPPQPILIA